MNTSSILRRFRPYNNKRMFSGIEARTRNFVSNAKSIYWESLPFTIPITIFVSFFSDITSVNTQDFTFMEFFIHSTVMGAFIGYTFPISYPLIAMNVVKKKLRLCAPK